MDEPPFAFGSHLGCQACNGLGACTACNGTGVNLDLHSDQPECPRCRGTKKCPECGGSGNSRTGPDIITLDLDK